MSRRRSVEYPAWGAQILRDGETITLHAADSDGDLPVELSAVEARDVATALLCAAGEAEKVGADLERKKVSSVTTSSPGSTAPAFTR